jgi:hypothetical protein
MFGQVLDKLDIWFGRSFLLSRYFPWLLFFISNLVIVYIEFPQARAFLITEYNGIGSTSKIIDIIIALGGIGVVAYTMSPMLQYITKFLEGENLWSRIAEPLLLKYTQQAETLTKQRYALFLERTGLPSTKNVVSQLTRMRSAGAEHRAIKDEKAIDRADKAIRTLRAKRYLNRAIRTGEFIAASQMLSEALRRNCSELELLDPPVRSNAYRNARRLDELHKEMTERVAPYAIDIAEKREARAFELRQRLFAGGDVAPTRLGNDAAALRSYCTTRYGIDFDFFWPRFQLAFQKNEKLSGALVTAKIQFDFSLLSFTLTAIFFIEWLIILWAFGKSLIAMSLIIVVGPLATAIWLRIVHASYSAFAELVRGAIDLSRFDLLQALHRSLPQSTEAERKVWERAARLLMLDEHDVDVSLKHTTL